MVGGNMTVVKEFECFLNGHRPVTREMMQQKVEWDIESVKDVTGQVIFLSSTCAICGRAIKLDWGPDPTQEHIWRLLDDE